MRLIAGSEFNHGERLYGRSDAIERAVLALPSSKAIALLIDHDEAGDPNREYPALTAIQLHARVGETGTLLDVVGFFRKQDLRLWWPVNMAELAYMQRHALQASEKNPALPEPVTPGRLISIASIGTHDNVLPQLAGTGLDRALDLRPEWPHRLALLAAQPRSETRDEWAEALADVGLRDGDKVLVPTIGLRRLSEALTMHRELGGSNEQLDRVIAAVRVLQTEAEGAAEHLTAGASVRKLAYWSNKLRSAAADVQVAVTPRARATTDGIPRPRRLQS